jgi:TetR/AcrR family transcriptional regulator, mexJK operon transcriptional repressor
LGRPRDLEKRAAIIEAARALMFARGVEAVTMEDIASRAGVSKVTVYNHFGDKEIVFEAVVRAESARMEQIMLMPRGRSDDLETELVRFGAALVGVLLSDQFVAFDRLLMHEAPRHRLLAKRFHEAGPGYIRDQLAALLGREVDLEEPHREELLRTAAEDLASLWLGFWSMTAKLGLTPSPGQTEIESHVRRTTRFFLKAWGEGSSQH